jgi:hypothetical protein
MSQYRVNEHRIYEGEWRFVCFPDCKGFLVEFSFDKYDNKAGQFLYNTPIHTCERCHLCNRELEWEGYSGGSPISDRLVSLLEGRHFMVSTVLLAAMVENALRNLLWAVLVDNGVDMQRANRVADGRMSRMDTIRTINALADLKVKDIAFPVRNLVAHGKELTRPQSKYEDDLRTQIAQIRRWVNHIREGQNPSNFMPSECERWLLFMSHWSYWLDSYVFKKLLVESESI